MANTIQIKRGTGTSALAAGELGFNTDTNTLYIGTSSGTNTAIGGSGAFLPLSGGTIQGSLGVKSGTITFGSSLLGELSCYNFGGAITGYLTVSNSNENASTRRRIGIESESSKSNDAEGLWFEVIRNNSDWSPYLVYHEGNIVYSTTQPTNPVKGMIWLEP